ncbi:Cys-tRNA(Pro) deacylase [Desulfobotulus sp. H1]|uniref:Cys-tRNA(Pro)/Cys-tRNA(Cys) deacylase n=1 Tax=Desulfobotulus pelophilus TaxID=2823377 RepID=A0ABT3N5C5_9BACT|nr:Cys-tRNA(Pro) deacylase [Desulfobotulus pelophilus]MCW7752655.1 Cys-tRNA(Pro) deacylase [Desulfobotulus pelophilus]
MTPAVHRIRKAGVAFRIHEYRHDPSWSSYGMEAAAKLGVDAGRVFKTLLVRLDPFGFALAVIPVEAMLSMKSVAKAAGSKKAEMARPEDVQRITGYVLGGVSPIGQKTDLVTVIDASAENFASIFVSAGRRGLDLELSPEDLKALTSGTFAGLCQ